MYAIQNWVNGSAGNTPVSADRLNHIEAGILATSLVADAAVVSVAGRTGVVLLTAADVGPGNFPAGTFNFTGTLQEAGNRVYSAGNPPPYPVTLVAGRSGSVVLTAADIGAGTFPGGVVFSQNNGPSFGQTSGNAPYIVGSGTTLKIRGGTSGIIYRNNADIANILIVDDTGHGLFGNGLEVDVTSSGASSVILKSDATGGRGPEIAFNDTKAAQTTPNKFIRCNGGVLQIANSAYSAIIWSLDDSGNVTFNGGLTFSPVTSTTAPTGGAAGALPTNPVGYMSITIGGTVRKIPYYT